MMMNSVVQAPTPISPRQYSASNNKLLPGDRAAHEWYRFVLSYPPHLVRDYLTRFGVHEGQTVLDPFCGTGTTLVECKKNGIASIGIEASPVAHFACSVKVDWTPDSRGLLSHAKSIAEQARKTLSQQGIDDEPEVLQGLRHNPGNLCLSSLPAESMKLLLENSISPLPLHKVLILLDSIEGHRDDRYYSHERLALAKSLVFTISNLHFGPEVGTGLIKNDAPVISSWLSELVVMSQDLVSLGLRKGTPSQVLCADSRDLLHILKPHTIDAVITSPPYPNEKDYTRTTRLEAVVLGFLKSKADLRAIKKGLVRSNTRNVYQADQDDKWVAGHAAIQRIADAIELRRIELNKTSGFEKLYARVTKLYFGGMAKHLADMRTILRPGARLAYVVGDQASYLRVMIRTGQLLAGIAESLGYRLEGTDLFRTRIATATKEQLREEVVVLHWPG